MPATVVVARAHELDLPLADPRPLFLGAEPTPAFLDLVHPDRLGHALLAQGVLAVLARDVPCLADLPRASFVAPWLRARREGLAAIDVDTCLDHAPPALKALLGTYADPCLIEQALASGRPESVARYDPVRGTDARRWPEEALRLQALRAEAAGEPEEAAELRERADRIRSQVWPPDPFARLVAGLPDDPGAAPVRFARALATFGR